MTSSTPSPPRHDESEGVPMSRLLAASAAAAAVCTPPAPADRADDDQDTADRDGDDRAGEAQGTTSTRVPIGAKSQSV
jgi:hypothetical protein